MTKRRVLVFPAGTEIGLEIFQALKHYKEIALFGAGQDILISCQIRLSGVSRAPQYS